MAISSKQGRRRTRVRSWYGVLIAAFALVVPLLALAESVPINLQAAIFMRALAYEKGFVADTSPALILVLGGGKAQKDATEMVAALRAFAGAGGAGRKTRIEEAPADLSLDELKKRAPQVLYVPQGAEAALANVSTLPKTIVLCGSPEAVGKGCILSVRLVSGSSRILIDLPGAEGKGFKFDARLLRVAEVIR